MPCDSSHMEPSTRELRLSQVATLLDELNGKPFNKRHWEGYHPRVYNTTVGKELADKMVSKLCQFLQSAADVTQYSLEMQIWWRDHQVEDRKRIQREFEAARQKADRRAAVAKLTPYERRLLGIQDERNV